MAESSLRRELGVVLLTGIGVGAVIGSGIYTLPSLLASVAGPLSFVAVVVMGIVTLLLMFIIAKLGVRYPKAGAIYYFSREILGDLNGFITGLSFYACCFVGTAAIIYTFILYLNYYVPGLAVGYTLTPLGTAISLIILAIVTLINILGVKYGAGLNFVLVIAKIVPLIVFIVFALTRFHPGNFADFAPFGLGAMGLALAFGFWMYLGFEAVVLVGEETRKPEEIIMKSAMLTVLIVATVYVLVTLGFLGAIDWTALGVQPGDWGAVGELSAPLADISRALGAVGLAELVFAGVIASTAGCFADWVLLQARVAFAMAREGRLWRTLAKVHPRYGSPYTALIFSSLLTAIVMILVPSFPNVILIAMIAEFIPYAISSLSLATLRHSSGHLLALGLIGFIVSSFYIYWGCWPWTLTGTIIAIVSLILYPIIVKNVSLFLKELKKNAWYVTYLIGLTIISLLGDTMFEYQNFLPISPQNILPMPTDLVAITVFAAVVFVWALKSQKTT